MPTLCQQFGEGPFLFQHDCGPVHKAKSTKTWFEKFGVEELQWPTQSPDLNPIWEKLECWGQARTSCPTSAPQHTKALLAERAQIPTDTKHFVESIFRIMEAVIAAKGPTPY